MAFVSGVFLTPDLGSYSVDTTFIRSHNPSEEGYVFSITSDDREDSDEDQSPEVEISTDFLAESFSFNSNGGQPSKKIDLRLEMTTGKVYVINHQFLI